MDYRQYWASYLKHHKGGRYIDFTAPGSPERGFFVLNNLDQCPAWAWGIYQDDENWVKRGTIPRSEEYHNFFSDKILPSATLTLKKGNWCEYCRKNDCFSWLDDENSECDGTPCIERIVKIRESERRADELKNTGLVYEQPVVPGHIFKTPVVKKKDPKKWPVPADIYHPSVEPLRRIDLRIDQRIDQRPPRKKPPRKKPPLGELFVDSPVRYLVRGPRGNPIEKKGLPYLRRGGFKDCPLCGHKGNLCKLVNWNDGGWDLMCPNCGCNGITREFETKERALKFWYEEYNEF